MLGVASFMAAFVFLIYAVIRASRLFHHRLVESVFGTTLQCVLFLVTRRVLIPLFLQVGSISLLFLVLLQGVLKISELVCPVRFWPFEPLTSLLVDGPFKDNLRELTEITIWMVTRIGGIVVMTPIFVIPGLIAGMVGGWVGRIYMAAQMSVKREMSNARAPVVGQ